MNQLKEKSQILRKPSWLKVRPPYSNECRNIRSTLAGLQLHTVCQEAACPNMAECFASWHGNISHYGQYMHARLFVLQC